MANWGAGGVVIESVGSVYRKARKEKHTDIKRKRWQGGKNFVRNQKGFN